MEEWSRDCTEIFWEIPKQRKNKGITSVGQFVLSQKKKQYSSVHLRLPLNFIVTFPTQRWRLTGQEGSTWGHFPLSRHSGPSLFPRKNLLCYSQIDPLLLIPRVRDFYRNIWITFALLSLWSSSHYNSAISWLINLARLLGQKKNHLIGREVSHMLTV